MQAIETAIGTVTDTTMHAFDILAATRWFGGLVVVCAVAVALIIAAIAITEKIRIDNETRYFGRPE